MKPKSIEHQIETLKWDVKRYASNRYQRQKKHLDQFKNYHPSQVERLVKFIKVQTAMGISDGDLANLTRHNLLPQTLQVLYEKLIGFHLQRDNPSQDAEHEPSATLSKKPRWTLNSWQCACGSDHTRWFRTHLEVKDCYQIYCAACHKLAGWGTEHELKSAQIKTHADLVIIDNPFERYEYDPPLMSPPPNGLPPRRIRTKRSRSS